VWNVFSLKSTNEVDAIDGKKKTKKKKKRQSLCHDSKIYLLRGAVLENYADFFEGDEGPPSSHFRRGGGWRIFFDLRSMDSMNFEDEG